jgi:hypothetical protein
VFACHRARSVQLRYLYERSFSLRTFGETLQTYDSVGVLQVALDQTVAFVLAASGVLFTLTASLLLLASLFFGGVFAHSVSANGDDLVYRVLQYSEYSAVNAFTK